MPVTLCVLAFIASLAFILILVQLVNKSRADGPVPKTFQEAITAFKEARTWRVRAFVVFICMPVFLGESYKVFVAILGIFAFICVIAICGSPGSVPILQSIRDILHEVYKFFSSK